MKLLHISVGK